MAFAKLRELDTINIQEAPKYDYVKWNDGKMEHSPVPAVGFRPDYKLVLDNNDSLSLTEAQLSKLLVACYADGKADLVGKKFKVTHNFQTKKFPDGEKEIDLAEFELIKEVQSSDDTELPDFLNEA